MLTREDNELLCKVGPGTPMGDLMRRYWIPALLSSELPEADGPPLRVRLLSEDLIAYRDSSGAVGMLAANCPHRGAALFFGRNEEGGLRCVYHGWKFDTEGNCVDMPNEPAESNFKHKIRATAYPCREHNGMIWVYMGPSEHKPAELPALESNLVPANHLVFCKRLHETNYMQGLEGGIDSSHASFLHAPLDPKTALSGDNARMVPLGLLKDRAPRFEVLDIDIGLMIGAHRDSDPGFEYVRTNLFLFPFYTFSPGAKPFCHWSAWVPMDDYTTMRTVAVLDPTEPITPERLEQIWRNGGPKFPDGSFTDDFMPATSKPGGAWVPRANQSNEYFFDREIQRTQRFFGVPDGTAGTEDQAATESMGPLYDRRLEHLGTADLGIIAARRRLIAAARALRDKGISPPGAVEARSYALRSPAVIVPKGGDWLTSTRSAMIVEPSSEFVTVDTYV